MAQQKLWYEDEDDFGCFECGVIEYAPSITEGLCIECNPTDPRHKETEE